MTYLKQYTLPILFSFFITSTFSQTIENQWKIEKIETGKMMLSNGDEIAIKQKTIEYGEIPVLLDPNDKYNLNQDLIVKPIEITKEIRSDYDNDDNYDRSIRVIYKSDSLANLNFRLGLGGLKVMSSEKGVKIEKINLVRNAIEVPQKGRIKKGGTYKLYLSNNQIVEMEVSDITTMYDNIK